MESLENRDVRAFLSSLPCREVRMKSLHLGMKAGRATLLCSQRPDSPGPSQQGVLWREGEDHPELPG